jgi:MFS transporter, DHA1 family, tetracycline resistance protein
MPNRILQILFLYSGLFNFAASLFGPLYAIYVERMGAGIMPVCYAYSIQLFSITLFTFIVSKLGDKCRPKVYMLSIGFLIRAVCWFIYIFIHTIPQLYLLQFVMGIGDAFSGPAFDALFAEHLDKDKHIMDYSDWRVVANAAIVLGTTLGGLIVSHYGFRTLFVFMSILACMSSLGVLINDSMENKTVE